MANEEIEKLKKIDLSTEEDDTIIDLLYVIELKLHSLNQQELNELFDVLVKILEKRKGIPGRRAEEILTVLYPKIKEKVVKLLWSDSAYIRSVAQRIIINNRDKSVLPRLMKDHDRDIRKFAIDIAFEMGDADFIRQGLDDPDTNVFVSSAEYLSRLGDSSSLSKIVELFRKVPKDDIYSLMFLIEAMIRLDYDKTYLLMKEKFDDVKDPIIAGVYLRACGISSDPNVVDDILSAIDDDSMRKEALESLLSFIRKNEKNISENLKEKIREKIEEKIASMTTSQLEDVRKIFDILKI